MINEVLKKLRTIYGYKAVEMSQLLGISPSYLSEIENGKKQPSLELLKKYSNVFGIKLSSLILMMESYDDAIEKGKSVAGIRMMMIHLIDRISVHGDNDEAEATKEKGSS